LAGLVQGHPLNALNPLGRLFRFDSGNPGFGVANSNEGPVTQVDAHDADDGGKRFNLVRGIERALAYA
jgi:hypothetical protein